MGIVHYLRDGMNGLVNRMTGTGTRRDPNSHNTYQFSKPNNSELEAIYRSNWIARKIVDIPIEDTLRQGWSWTADDAIITKIEAEEKRLNVKGILTQALTRDAIYGGSAFIMGTTDTDLSAEINLQRITTGSLRYLTPFHAEDLHIEGLSREPDKLGQPTMFVFRQESGKDLRIHPSRVISFVNRPIEKPLARMTWEDFWGDSRLANVLSDISGASTALTGGARLMGELAIWTYKINGLAETISTVGGEESVQKLLTMATTLKSSLNAVAFDAQDEVDIVTANTSGIGETIRTFMQNVAGAADIPYTRFMAASPDGMNATGDSDTRNYYDMLVGRRQAHIDPQMEKFDQVFLRSALGRFDDKIYRTWKPLWQLNEVQQAELDGKKMTMFGSMLDKGLVHDHVIESIVHTTMIESPTFPGAEEAIEESKSIPDPRDEEDEESTALTGGKPGAAKPAANQPKAPSAEVKLRIVKDAAPAPLYVMRKVMNAGQILRWANQAGFTDLLKADDLHVTVLYSETPVDWMEMGNDMYEDDEMRIGAGGPRVLEKFGDATVLLFASPRLGWRHESMIEAGASHGHAKYQPHISLSYSPQSVNLEDVVPYPGPIVLGPEIFEPLDTDWKDNLTSDEMFEDKAGKFNENAINRHKAGSSKGGQFAPKGANFTTSSQSAADKYHQAVADTKKSWERTSKYSAKAKDHEEHAINLAAKKKAADEYFSTLGTTRAAMINEIISDKKGGESDSPDAAKSQGPSKQEQMVAIKAQRSKSYKEYKAAIAAEKAGTEGSAEQKKKSLAEYNTLDKTYKALESGKDSGSLDKLPISAKPIRDSVVDQTATKAFVNPKALQNKESWNKVLSGEIKPIDGGRTIMSDYLKSVGNALGGEDAQKKPSSEFTSGVDSLTSAEKSNLRKYTGMPFFSINNTLRDGIVPNDKDRKIIESVDKAFEKSKADKDFVVYRGISDLTSVVGGGKLEPGAVLFDGAYQSTSVNTAVAAGFGGGDGYRMVIRVKKGQTIMGVKEISEYPSHEEYTLPRNTAMKVHAIDESMRTIIVDIME